MMSPPRWPRGTALCVLTLLFASCATTTAPTTATPEEVELARKVAEFVAGKVNQGEFTGVVLLAREGRPFLHSAHGAADRERGVSNTAETRFNIASLGKMFTAVAIGQLVDDGKLAWQTPIGRYLPELDNPSIADKVTLHHLLTHTSGVPDLPDTLFNAPPAQLSGYLPFLSSAALEFEPGQKRSYSNSGFVLAGLIIERVTGEPYADRIRRRIFGPAGMTSTRFEPNGVATSYDKAEATGALTRTIASSHHGGPHGGSYATASDLMKFFEALRSGKLMAPETAAVVTTPREGAAAAYGFGTIDFDRDRLVGHSGGDAGVSANAFHYWESGYTIVVLSNLGAPAAHDVASHARKLLEERFKDSPVP